MNIYVDRRSLEGLQPCSTGGGGEKIERWGNQILQRPDPQAIWPRDKDCKVWNKPNAIYHRSNAGGGKWEIRKLPEQWAIHYGDLTFQLKPMSFKHTGLFPEQAANWVLSTR